MNIIITQYPLTSKYLEAFHKKFSGETRVIVISNIIASGYLGVFAYFASIKADTIYIPVIDEENMGGLSIFKLLSLLSRAKKRVIVNQDLSLSAFSYRHVILDAFSLTLSVVSGACLLVLNWFTIRSLLWAPREDFPLGKTDKILYLRTNLWLGVQAGGSLSHMVGVINALIKKGLSVNFVSAEIPSFIRRSERLSILRIKPPNNYVVPREFNYYRHNNNVIKTVIPELTSDYRFVYQRLSLGSIVGVIISRLKKIPLIIEFNGSEVWLSRNWGRPLSFEKVAQYAEDVCLRHAHLVVTVSNALKDELIARGIDKERVLVQPNGVDINVFDSSRFDGEEILQLRDSYGISQDAIIVGFIGTFGHWHGAEVLAESMKELFEHNQQWMKDKKLHFMFIGDGIRRETVETILSDDALAPFYTITGLISFDLIPKHMAAIDIFAAPIVPNKDGTPFFGSPTKLFEYMSAGRPVIGSDLDQISEVMEGSPTITELEQDDIKQTQEQCGVLVKPEDPGQLAQAVRFLIDNKSWRINAGKNARQRAVSRYTWDTHVRGIVEKIETQNEKIPPRVQKKVRVLINGLHAKTGGGVTYIRNILPMLSKDPELEVHLCIHDSQRKLMEKMQLTCPMYYLSFKTGFWRLPLWEQYHVPKLARQIAADVTFSPANYGPLMAPNPVILLRNSLSVALVERRVLKIAYWAFVYMGTMLSLIGARRAIVVSKYARRSVGAGLSGILWKKTSIIYHGVSDIFKNVSAVESREDFLLAVSDIYVQKNFLNLFKAVKSIKNSHPDIKLKVVGRPVDKEYCQLLEAYVSDNHLEDNIKFLGHKSVEEVVDLYRRCRVFVFPSYVETFGNPLVEAMSCGAAIACSNAAAMPEVVQDSAIFFNPNNVEEIAKSILTIVNDENLQRRLRERALERAQSFSWEDTAARTSAVIKQASWKQTS